MEVDERAEEQAAVDDAAVAILFEMGYDLEVAVAALRATGNTGAEAALNFIFQNSEGSREVPTELDIPRKTMENDMELARSGSDDGDRLTPPGGRVNTKSLVKGKMRDVLLRGKGRKKKHVENEVLTHRKVVGDRSGTISPSAEPDAIEYPRVDDRIRGVIIGDGADVEEPTSGATNDVIADGELEAVPVDPVASPSPPKVTAKDALISLMLSKATPEVEILPRREASTEDNLKPKKKERRENDVSWHATTVEDNKEPDKLEKEELEKEMREKEEKEKQEKEMQEKQMRKEKLEKEIEKEEKGKEEEKQEGKENQDSAIPDVSASKPEPISVPDPDESRRRVIYAVLDGSQRPKGIGTAMRQRSSHRRSQRSIEVPSSPSNWPTVSPTSPSKRFSRQRSLQRRTPKAKTPSDTTSERQEGEDWSDIDDDGSFYEEDFSDDGDDGYEEEFADQSSHVVLSEAALKESVNGEVRVVSAFCGVSDETAHILLRSFDFDKVKLIREWANDPEAVKRDAGISSSGIAKEIDSPTCNICFDDFRKEELFALACGHGLCRDCWQGYLGLKIKEGDVKNVICPGFKCKMAVSDDFVQKLTCPQDYARYKEFLSKVFVDENPNIRWCPGAGCNKAVDISNIVGTSMVRCSCGVSFCIRCNGPPHDPATCQQVKQWKKKCEDDSETYSWISVNAQECPNCSATIEKNGGCNHMTCRQCKHEFCWVCGSVWKGHSYSCNRYDRRKQQVQSKQKESLERYLHYYHRFILHREAIAKEEIIREKAMEKMEKMANAGAAWVDVQFVKPSFEGLNECRSVLLWTYVYAYYLPAGAEKELFEFAQQELEATTDALAEQLELEEITPEMRVPIIDRTRNTKKKLSNLLQMVSEQG